MKIPSVEESESVKVNGTNGIESEEKHEKLKSSANLLIASSDEVSNSQTSVDSTVQENGTETIVENGTEPGEEVKEGTVNGDNKLDDSFSYGSSQQNDDDAFSDASDESLTLQVTDEEDEGQPKETEKGDNSTSEWNQWDNTVASSSNDKPAIDNPISETEAEMAVVDTKTEKCDSELKENDDSASESDETNLLEPEKENVEDNEKEDNTTSEEMSKDLNEMAQDFDDISKDSDDISKHPDEISMVTDDKNSDEISKDPEEMSQDPDEMDTNEKDPDEIVNDLDDNSKDPEGTLEDADEILENPDEILNTSDEIPDDLDENNTIDDKTVKDTMETAENLNDSTEEYSLNLDTNEPVSDDNQIDLEQSMKELDDTIKISEDDADELPNKSEIKTEDDSIPNNAQSEKSAESVDEKMDVDPVDTEINSESKDTEPENVLDEIDKILKDDNSEASVVSEDASFDNSEYSDEEKLPLGKSKKLKKSRKKKFLRKTLKNKKIKISKTFVEKWRVVKQAENERNELARIDNEVSAEEKSELETLDEVDKESDHCDKDISDDNSEAIKTSLDENSCSNSEIPTNESKTENVPTTVESMDLDSVSNMSDNLLEKSEKDNQTIEDKMKTENTIKAEDNDSIESSTNSKKRQLQDEIEEESSAKKIKINLEDVKTVKKEYVKLDSFREFLENKLNKLTRKQLEEFCIQKICEVLGQNSELGELRHQIKRQEQMLETWRAKVIAISKQTRDLEVVKCRLVQEIKTKEKESGRIQDITPIKITRSVGLQVGLQSHARAPRLAPTLPIQSPPALDAIQKRKARPSLPNRPIPPSPATNPTPPQNRVLPTVQQKPSPQKQTAPVPKTIKTIPPVVRTPSKESPSILNKALQKTNSSTAGAAPKVIDLTDEEETNKVQPPPTKPSNPPPTSVANGVRLVPTHSITNTPITSTPSLVATSVSGPRLTYLVTPNGQTPQPVVLHTFATSAGPTRPGQVRSQFMFKPISSNSVGQQRLNIRIPGNQVMLNQGARPNGSIRIGQIPGIQRAVAPPRQPAPRSAPSSALTRHPAPLPGPPPLQPSQPNWKAMPPRPSLKISRVGDGIVLSWKILTKDLSHYEEIASYQLYAYQETNAPPNSEMWRKVGDVKALALPMACTLTQFTDGNKYHFAVRAVDVKSRVGPFSQPEQITLS